MTTLTKERRDDIEVRADSILRNAYGENRLTPPIDLQKVLDEHGIQVKEIDFPEDRKEIAGIYDKGKKLIFVAGGDYFPRQMFTIAHELGHFFLHESKETEIFLRTDASKIGLNEKSLEEKEADYFAATLLMPEKLVRNYWIVLNNVQQIAELFGVSAQAMVWRLKNLGILSYDSE